MKSNKIWLTATFTLSLVLASSLAFAKVTPEEAAKLKTTLTPFGAERAGNADGTIPAWDGGISAPPQGLGYKGPGHRHPDPYADDKVLFSITAKNLDQYADKLIEGQKVLLKKYPDSYRIDVYPSRRSHAAPDWVYENTFINATRTEVNEDGSRVSNAYGGIPFPIPKTGVEVMWNHLLRWQADGTNFNYGAYIVQRNGQISAGAGGQVSEKFPYYQKDGSLETYNGDYWYIFVNYQMPARRKGEVVLVKDPLNQAENPRKAWQYLVGQRRVRRAPTLAYDTPNPAFSGATTWDDVFVFNGALDRYDWKLLGKKEMYIPYNCYKGDEQYDLKDMYQAGHVNPDMLRWELHRVWVVEANLKQGKRHVYARRVLLIDEDSWGAVLADSYDGRGSLWRSNMGLVLNAYELPGVVQRLQVHYDLQRDQYAINNAQTAFPEITVYGNPKDDDYFTPEQIRRRGKR